MKATLELGVKIPREIAERKYNCGERMARRYPNGTVYLYEPKHVVHPSGDIGPRRALDEISFVCGDWFEVSDEAAFNYICAMSGFARPRPWLLSRPQ